MCTMNLEGIEILGLQKRSQNAVHNDNREIILLLIVLKAFSLHVLTCKSESIWAE